MSKDESRFNDWGPGALDFSNEPAAAGKVDIQKSAEIDEEFARLMRADGATEEEIAAALSESE